jgi:hypothetical protein
MCVSLYGVLIVRQSVVQTSTIMFNGLPDLMLQDQEKWRSKISHFQRAENSFTKAMIPRNAQNSGENDIHRKDSPWNEQHLGDGRIATLLHFQETRKAVQEVEGATSAFHGDSRIPFDIRPCLHDSDFASLAEDLDGNHRFVMYAPRRHTFTVCSLFFIG